MLQAIALIGLLVFGHNAQAQTPLLKESEWRLEEAEENAIQAVLNLVREPLERFKTT